MQNVLSTVPRTAGSCLRVSASSTNQPVLRNVLSILTRPQNSTRCHCSPSRNRWTISGPAVDLRLPCAIQSRQFSHSAAIRFSESAILQKLKPYKSKTLENGLAFRRNDLSYQELVEVFGHHVPPSQFANRLLRVLHARRVDGTLDIDPPGDIKRQFRRYPNAAAAALKWLRKNYPIDEDAAIMARIEREEASTEQENPAELMARAEELGLYKPQSGRFGRKLGPGGDIFGESELDRIRAENVAKAEQEEKELEEDIQKIQTAAKKKAGQLQVRNENAVEVAKEQRPPNTYEKWVLRHKKTAESKLDLDSPEIANTSTARRILPSFLFTLLSTFLCYLLTQYWTPPPRNERLWPNLSLSYATLFGIASVNIFVFTLWRLFPPAWRLLNRYFLNVPATPHAPSILGSVFSHQSLLHLAVNTLALTLVPVAARLHEEVGRGTFLAMYVGTGVWAGFIPLAFWAATRQFTLSTLGASGAVYGIFAAYLTIHATDRQFTFFFFPRSWKNSDWAYIKGWMVLVALLSFEIGSFVLSRSRSKPFRVPFAGGKVDYLGHLSGAAAGVASGLWWRREKVRRREGGNRDETKWFERMFGKTSKR